MDPLILFLESPINLLSIHFYTNSISIIIWVNHPPNPYVLGYSPKIMGTSVAVLVYAYCKILSYHISFGQVITFTILVWYQRFLVLSYQLVPFLSCRLQKQFKRYSQISMTYCSHGIKLHKMTLGPLSSTSSMSF